MRRNPLNHPKTTTTQRAVELTRADRAALSDDRFKQRVDRGWRQFWARRGVEVASSTRWNASF